MLTNGEAINTGYKTYLRLLKYAVPYWLIFILGALAMLIYALTDTGFAYLIKTLTDNFAGTTDGAYIGEWKFNLPIAVIVIFIIRGKWRNTSANPIIDKLSMCSIMRIPSSFMPSPPCPINDEFG